MELMDLPLMPGGSGRELPLNEFGCVVEQVLGKWKNLYILLLSSVETSNGR